MIFAWANTGAIGAILALVTLAQIATDQEAHTDYAHTQAAEDIKADTSLSGSVNDVQTARLDAASGPCRFEFST